jgi:protein SCO1/2
MLQIYDEFERNPNLKLISYTLDPKRDTPERLRMYGDNLDIDHNKWLFLKGPDQDETYDFAFEHLVPAMQDDEAPGGINHSGSIILIDKDRHIRSFGDGTDPESVDKLIKDIRKLLKEFEN